MGTLTSSLSTCAVVALAFLPAAIAGHATSNSIGNRFNGVDISDRGPRVMNLSPPATGTGHTIAGRSVPSGNTPLVLECIQESCAAKTGVRYTAGQRLTFTDLGRSLTLSREAAERANEKSVPLTDIAKYGKLHEVGGVTLVRFGKWAARVSFSDSSSTVNTVTRW